MDEPSFGIDEIHARAEPIERIGERRGFRSFELKHSSDQHGTSEMRSDQAHVPPRLLVDDAVSLMAEHSEYRSAYCSPVDEHAHEIDNALRLGPFTINSVSASSPKASNRWSQSAVQGRRESAARRMHRSVERVRPATASGIQSDAGIGGVRDADILAEKSAANAADKWVALWMASSQQRGIDGSIVNDADQVAQMLLIMEIAWRGQCGDRSQM